jgi:cysteine desulfurase
VHFLVCAAHKLHGPKGVGFLHVNHRIKIKPMIYGGAQERNMRGGTENVYGIAGLAKAIRTGLYRYGRTSGSTYRALKAYMIEQLKTEVDGIEFNGEIAPEKSLYTVLNVSFPAMDMADMLLFNLDIAGISASGGSACSSGTDIGSHVLTALGVPIPTRPSVRFSFSKYNTKEEVDLYSCQGKGVVFGEGISYVYVIYHRAISAETWCMLDFKDCHDFPVSSFF